MSDDDLDLMLADLRSDVPEMTDEAFAAGRDRLPGGSGGAVVTRLPAEFSDAPGHARPLRSPPRRLAQLVGAAAGVVAIAAAAVLTQSAPPEPTPVGSREQLAEWARTLADDDPLVGPGQYRYVRIEHSYTWHINSIPNLQTRTEMDSEVWVPADWRDDWLKLREEPTVTWLKGSPAEAEAAGLHAPWEGLSTFEPLRWSGPCGDVDSEMVHRDYPWEPCGGDGWMQEASPEFFSSLSGDPGKLYATLRERAEGAGLTPDLETLVQATENLLKYNSPPEFRATLYEALSMIPSLMVREDANGITISVSAQGRTESVVLDRDTGDYIGLRESDDMSLSERTLTYATVDEPEARPAR